MWLNIAAMDGNDNATRAREMAAKEMTPAQIAEAETLARKCVEQNFKDCSK